jgi:hypothetical protein
MGTLYADALREMPVIPGSSLKNIKPNPEFDHLPDVEAELVSPRNLEQTVAWYKAKLRARGWGAERGSNEENPLDGPGSPNSGGIVFNVYRDRWFVGDKPLIQEYLWLRMTPMDSPGRTPCTKVEFNLRGDYVWDWPAKSAYSTVYGIGWLLGMMVGSEAVMTPFSWAAKPF